MGSEILRLFEPPKVSIDHLIIAHMKRIPNNFHKIAIRQDKVKHHIHHQEKKVCLHPEFLFRKEYISVESAFFHLHQE
jgi:hypothetical protein